MFPGDNKGGPQLGVGVGAGSVPAEVSAIWPLGAEDGVRLAPAAAVLVRDDEHVQFGLNGAQAGIMHSPQAVQVVRILSQTTTATVSVGHLVGQLVTELGLGEEQAKSIIEELVVYRVLHKQPAMRGMGVYEAPDERAELTLLGHGELAEEIKRLCVAHELRLQMVGDDGSELHFLYARDMHPDPRPIVVVDRGSHTRLFSPALSARTSTWIPVTIIDGRGHIGPLHIRGVGPCPLCMDLYAAAADPCHYRVLTQLTGTQSSSRNPVAVSATAARCVGVLLDLLRPHRDPPPGLQPVWRPQAGTMLSIDVFKEQPETRREFKPHPRCPVCHDARRI